MIVWTDYIKYRAKLRGYDLQIIENILRSGDERYFDTATERCVVIGRHRKRLVVIPYEKENNDITPNTIHPTSRQQINFRIKSGRFRHE